MKRPGYQRDERLHGVSATPQHQASSLMSHRRSSGSGAVRLAARRALQRPRALILPVVFLLCIAAFIWLFAFAPEASKASAAEAAADTSSLPQQQQQPPLPPSNAQASPLSTGERRFASIPVNMSRTIGRVSSLRELREFCDTHAPQLKDISWVRKKKGNVTMHTTWGGGIRYYAESVPVCTTEKGDILVDHTRFDAGESVLHRHATFPVAALRDDAFRLDGQLGYAEAVPALALLAKAKWIDSHIWHLIRDCIGSLMSFFHRYNSGEVFTIPTQAVLLRDETNSWVDRYGDTRRKMELSSKVLNSFSSPRLGGPFFNASPLVVYGGAGMEDSRGVQERLAQPLMQCYCQALAVGQKKLRGNMDPNLFYSIQDLVARQFGEEDYQHGYPLAEVDARRLASHPWATQFWNEPTFNHLGQYRPRALVIHRQSRLIGDIDKFVEHLKKLDFRVLEVFPEKYPLDQQYHMGRYADMIIGMHGLGIAHSFWMDRFPIGCRTVVEFRPWVMPELPVDLYKILGEYMRFNYRYPSPIDVVFGPSVRDKQRARERLLNRSYVRSAWSFREFTDQTAYYDVNKVRQMFSKIREHLLDCLDQAQYVPRYSPVLVDY